MSDIGFLLLYFLPKFMCLLLEFQQHMLFVVHVCFL